MLNKNFLKQVHVGIVYNNLKTMKTVVGEVSQLIEILKY